MIDVGIIGASGYTGAELLRLCASHPELRVVFATGDSQAGTALAELYPSLAAAYPGLVFDSYDPALLDGVDLVFCGLPHGASQALMPVLREKVRWVVDLAADFRLQDADLYPTWYGEPHAAPELLPGFAYGLPELHRAEIVGASAVATPGCYPTAAALAMAPLVQHGLVETRGIVVNAVSGVSGAGRPPKPNTTFCTVDEDFTAYGLLAHRHTPEMEQTVARLAGAAPDDVSVLFTPHLAPMNRGMLATCYLRPVAGTTTAELLDLYRQSYAGRPSSSSPRARRPPRPASAPTRPTSPSGPTPAPAGSWPSPPSTTSPRAPPARPCSAPTSSPACPSRPASPPQGCTHEPWRAKRADQRSSQRSSGAVREVPTAGEGQPR